MKNIFTIDLEDWYHASLVNREKWETCEDRVVEPTRRILYLLKQTNNKATFFTLAYVAEKFPDLIRQIVSEGHEISCHSYDHQLIYDQSQQQFLNDILKSKNILEQTIDQPIYGYRAPSWSLKRKNDWAWEILYDNGFRYDSSLYPFKTFLYGDNNNPRFQYKLDFSNNGKILVEIPPATMNIMGKRIPFGGGFFFRVLPYWFIKSCIHYINNREKQPAVIYLHPWEIDSGIPRISNGFKEDFILYKNIEKAEHKLEKLLNEFEFISFKQYLNIE